MGKKKKKGVQYQDDIMTESEVDAHTHIFTHTRCLILRLSLGGVYR